MTTNTINYPTPTRWDARIEGLQKKIERLERITNRPMQTPGAFVTGRSGRSRSLNRQHERELDRRMTTFDELQEAKAQLRIWVSRRADWLAGEVNANGQPRADAPSRLAANRTKASIADFLRATIRVGDAVYNPGGNLITVKRVNSKSVTSEGGVNWSYDEITPACGDRAMTPSEFVAAYRSWKSVAACVAA